MEQSTTRGLHLLSYEETVDETKALTETAILEIVMAYDPIAAREQARRMRDYHQLRKFGWSHDDVLTAFQTHYPYRAHLNEPSPNQYWGGWKYGLDAAPMRDWLRHYYYKMHATKGSLTYEEFVATWKSLANDDWLHSHRNAQDDLYFYIQARRSGLDDMEARWLLRNTSGQGLDYRHDYITLRKKLGRQLVEWIIFYAMSRHREAYHSLSTKYILEAYRRGVDENTLLTSIKTSTTRALALSLRHPESV